MPNDYCRPGYCQILGHPEWHNLDPFSDEARAERAKCHCSYSQYCGPGCSAHTE